MQNEYTLAIAVFDNGFPRLSSETTVKIMVPENHPPTVPEFTSFEVFENKMRGTIVGKIEATDIDISENSTQQLTYKIIEEGQDFFFLFFFLALSLSFYLTVLSRKSPNIHVI